VQIENVKNLNFQVERSRYSSESAVKAPVENLKEPLFTEMATAEEGIFKKTAGEEDLKDLASGLEKFALEIKKTRFEFSVHEETKRVIVRIYDMNTDELISEIPPEKFLDLIANIWKQVGLIIDKKV
jgi:flagellar protein FlaG